MRKQKGQTLLITMLVLTVATTIALSLIGRASTDISITGQIEESARAFSAAEAGIEEALKTKTSNLDYVPVAEGSNASFKATVTSVGGGTTTYILPSVTKEGDVDTVWLVGHDATSAKPSDTAIDKDKKPLPPYTGSYIDVCWNQANPTPAVEISILYKEDVVSDQFQVLRYAYDPDGASRSPENNFTHGPITINDCGTGTGMYYRQTIDLSGVTSIGGIPYALRIRPYYNDAQFMVFPLTDIPSQGLEVSSVGQTGSGVTRKIVVKQQYALPPSILDYTIYSQGSFGHAP